MLLASLMLVLSVFLAACTDKGSNAGEGEKDSGKTDDSKAEESKDDEKEENQVRV